MGEEVRYLCDSLIIFGEVVFTEGVFCDTLLASNGCDSIHCIDVIQADFPNFTFPDDLTLEAGVDITIDLDPDYIYTWDPPGIIPDCDHCPELIFTLDSTTTFSVTITNDEGCPREDSVKLRVYPICAANNVKRPNAFTPNGDGVSDKFSFHIPEDHLEQVVSMTIYNRWGSIVYEGSGNDACWDGTFKDKPQPADVYIYVIEVGCSRNNIEVLHGDLTLMR